ncbi:hypothetical protein R4P47_06890 [Rhodococcus sp. IEGM 1370]|uniref:hypothetical protein n=1 Tax=Rhodococcus sp. IEGM 1370 TaxID=3082222 RepID=UPI0029534FB3|nr:hypothetical protein [Rhodococcus sp. IEGM 1370]MDV8076280.1 hypothetical protein [Rhodococcus sp. IEGM 1370]
MIHGFSPKPEAPFRIRRPSTGEIVTTTILATVVESPSHRVRPDLFRVRHESVDTTTDALREQWGEPYLIFLDAEDYL